MESKSTKVMKWIFVAIVVIAVLAGIGSGLMGGGKSSSSSNTGSYTTTESMF